MSGDREPTRQARCVCGHVYGHHYNTSPMGSTRCEWHPDCRCPRFIAATLSPPAGLGEVEKP